MIDDIKKLEKSTFEEDDSFEMPPPDIVSYNELRSCADLFRMYTNKILEIQPVFQREIVWKDHQQTRFIDSLVKGLPIPSLCFALDYKTQKWQVIDGLQRMWSIIRFLSDAGWKLSKLDDIEPKLAGELVSKFIDRNSELHSYYMQVENLTLPITVIRSDFSKPSHTNYLFTIFHRLNTGADKLNNQEIRNCIYSGRFNELLKELNQNSTWMKLNKMQKTVGHRFTKHELILRFFAFHDKYQDYGGRLARFLNDYMHVNRNPTDEFLTEKKNLFNRTVDIVFKSIFEGKPPQVITVSILEAIMVGVSFNLPLVESKTNADIQGMYANLLKDNEFSDDRLKEGLSGKPRVIGRMSTAKRVFSE